MDWYKLLPDDLRAAAYESKGGEYAWNKTDALRVIDILSQNGYTILGVDIWLPTDPGPTIPTPFVYDWTLRADQDLPSQEYPRTAEDLVRKFKWDPTDKSHNDMAPYFNFGAIRHQ
jgi:hypothetical protein